MHDKTKPFELSEPDRYSRLFPPAETVIAATDPRLTGLAWSMCDKIVKQPHDPNRRQIPAGYTYFGQFIDHDLTSEDFTPLQDGAIREPRDTPNLRLNWLNLDMLYGGGPCAMPKIYEDDGASLRIGSKLICNQTFDVPLDPDSQKPMVAEPRNLENAIIRQVHAMFLKLHNLAVSETPTTWVPSRRFSVARRRVCHQYQWLVRNDFLPKICGRPACSSIFAEPMFEWDGRFSIPIEFSRAAFRFGHSMVKESYSLDPNQPTVPLSELFGNRNTPGPLPDNFVVPWSRFLKTPAKQEANDINTGIVSPLFHIPGPSARLFKSVPPGQDELVLPHKTLQRGAASRLPSGQVVRRALKAAAIASEDVRPDPWLDLKYYCLQEQTPLWYYILLEAEVNSHGTCLGPVGSRIVGEVIEGALWANKDSYLWWHQDKPDWKPEMWVPAGTSGIQIETLHDVAVVVGVPKP